jgi:hypothetical protein
VEIRSHLPGHPGVFCAAATLAKAVANANTMISLFMCFLFIVFAPHKAAAVPIVEIT